MPASASARGEVGVSGEGEKDAAQSLDQEVRLSMCKYGLGGSIQRKFCLILFLKPNYFVGLHGRNRSHRSPGRIQAKNGGPFFEFQWFDLPRMKDLQLIVGIRD